MDVTEHPAAAVALECTETLARDDSDAAPAEKPQGTIVLSGTLALAWKKLFTFPCTADESDLAADRDGRQRLTLLAVLVQLRHEVAGSNAVMATLLQDLFNLICKCKRRQLALEGDVPATAVPLAAERRVASAAVEVVLKLVPKCADSLALFDFIHSKVSSAMTEHSAGLQLLLTLLDAFVGSPDRVDDMTKWAPEVVAMHLRRSLQCAGAGADTDADRCAMLTLQFIAKLEAGASPEARLHRKAGDLDVMADACRFVRHSLGRAEAHLQLLLPGSVSDGDDADTDSDDVASLCVYGLNFTATCMLHGARGDAVAGVVEAVLALGARPDVYKLGFDVYNAMLQTVYTAASAALLPYSYVTRDLPCSPLLEAVTVAGPHMAAFVTRALQTLKAVPAVVCGEHEWDAALSTALDVAVLVATVAAGDRAAFVATITTDVAELGAGDIGADARVLCENTLFVLRNVVRP